MYKINDEIREIFYSGGADYKAKVLINGTEINQNKIEKITILNPFFDNTSQTFYLGQFISQKVEIYFNDTNEISTTGNVEISIGVRKDTDNNEYTYIPIGKYIIDSSNEDYYKNKKIVCLDYAIKMKTNVDYSNLIIDSSGNITPISIEKLLQWLCNYFGIELGTYPDTNKDYLISTYDSTLSGKYYVSLIAELMGGIAVIDRYGKLNIIPIKQEPAVTRNATKNESWEYYNKYIISGVKYDNGTLYKFSGNESNNVLYIRSNNMFVLDNYETLIENIYNAVKDTTICSLKTKQPCDLSLDRWDLIEYDVDGVKYLTYNNNSITYEMSIVSEINTQIPTKVQETTTNFIETNDKDKIRKIETIVNQQDLELKIIAKEQGEINKIVQTNNSVEGYPIEIYDAGAYNLQKNVVYGNSEQATRSGRNLYNFEDTTEVNNSYSVDKDGWITITYDNTNGNKNMFFNYYTNNLNLKTSTDYAIIMEVKSVSGSGNIQTCSHYNNSGQFYNNTDYTFSNLEDNTIYINIRQSKDSFDGLDEKGLRSFVYFTIGKSGSITFRLSVLEDTTITADTFEYEQYGASPSPDYPSEINNVGNGNWLVEKVTQEDKETILKVDLQGNELCKIGDIADELDVKNGILTKRIGKIESYNGETITNPYISTTGQLTNGSTIYYVLAEPETIQLDKNDLMLFEGYNLITLDSKVEPNKIVVEYLTDSSFNEQYASKSELIVQSDRITQVTNSTTSISNNLISLTGRVGDIEGQTAEISVINNKVTNLQTSTQSLLKFENDVKENGVTKVHTETNYVFDKDGLVINESNENVSSRLNNKGLAIFDGEIKDNSDDAILYAGYDSKYSSSVLKTQKMIINDKLRFENYTTEDGKDAVGCFWVGD